MRLQKVEMAAGRGRKLLTVDPEVEGIVGFNTDASLRA